LPNGIYYTQGRISLRFTRLTTAIPGVKLREGENQGEFFEKLTRVVLLLSNSDSPIVIWRKK
jgi:hypothetical protein